MDKKNGYQLSRAWFDFAFEHQGELSTTHTAMYLWFVELNNRMGWVKQFYSPASQTMVAIGLKSYKTYKKVFDELVEFGFVKVVKESVNQYTACVIALVNFTEAHTKASPKHIPKHIPKQVQSTYQSNDSINKQETNKQINLKPKTVKKFSPPSKDNIELYFIEKITESKWSEQDSIFEAKKFFDFYDSKNWMVGSNKMSNWKSAVSGWINRSKNYSNGKSNSNTTKKSTEQNRSELQNLSNRSEEFLRLFDTEGL